MSSPVMIYDGQCAFCRRWIARWQRWTRGRIEYAPYQRAGERFPQIPPREFRRAVQLVEPDGRVSSAAAAVFRSLALAGRVRWAGWLYEHVPPFAHLTEAMYRWVARHRGSL